MFRRWGGLEVFLEVKWLSLDARGLLIDAVPCDRKRKRERERGRKKNKVLFSSKTLTHSLTHSLTHYLNQQTGPLSRRCGFFSSSQVPSLLFPFFVLAEGGQTFSELARITPSTDPKHPYPAQPNLPAKFTFQFKFIRVHPRPQIFASQTSFSFNFIHTYSFLVSHPISTLCTFLPSSYPHTHIAHITQNTQIATMVATNGTSTHHNQGTFLFTVSHYCHFHTQERYGLLTFPSLPV